MSKPPCLQQSTMHPKRAKPATPETRSKTGRSRSFQITSKPLVLLVLILLSFFAEQENAMVFINTLITTRSVTGPDQPLGGGCEERVATSVSPLVARDCTPVNPEHYVYPSRSLTTPFTPEHHTPSLSLSSLQKPNLSVDRSTFFFDADPALLSPLPKENANIYICSSFRIVLHAKNPINSPPAAQICYSSENDIMPERKPTKTPPRLKNPDYSQHTHYPPLSTPVNPVQSGFPAPSLST
jgi:hypothetical protein